LSSWTTYTVTERAGPAAIAQKIGVDADTLMEVNKIPAGMRLKPGSTIVVPRGDDVDEDISADVAESAVLAMEPDVPDTRKMLIRVRRAQSMAALASRYDVSVGQLKAWNRTRRNDVRAGQAIVLHVPVGKRVPTEPGPEKLATDVQGGSVQKISTQVSEPRYDKKGKARGKTTVVKVAAPAADKGKLTKVSASTPTGKASKAAAPSRTKTAASSKKSK